MVKGYVVGSIDVCDPIAYAEYAKASVSALAAHGGKAIVRGGVQEALEGRMGGRTVVLEFINFEAAKAYYDSDEYQRARTLRNGAAHVNLVAVEGAE